MAYKKTGIPEQNLTKELRNKSHEAFEIIFHRYYADLYRFAVAYLMDQEAAKDIVQETFGTLWSSASSLPENLNIKSYLYASIKNACLNQFKHMQVIDLNAEKLTEALIFSGTAEYEDNQELLEKVKACLQQLPEQQRRVLEMKVFQDMTYREIATALHISEITVHTHITRAYKFIRKALPVFYLLLKYWERL